jgi:ferrous iron transport protein B
MATVVDLPGIYSLSPYTSEEIVTRDFLIKEKPDGIINIVDATNIERSLYLSMQLIELNLPMVIALNMMDEMRANGNTVDVNKLEEELGVPVVPISAAKNEGIDELIEHPLRAAQLKMLPKRQDFCSGAVHRCIHSLAHIVEDHAEAAGVPMRFAATKLVEGDKPMMDMLRLSENEVELIGHTVAEMEAELGTDREAALADMRYAFIEKLCAQTVVKKGESKEHLRSMRLDRVLTGKYTAIPIFLGIMFLIFWLTFGVIGTWLSDLLSLGIDAVTSLVDRGLTAYGINPVVHSLIIDGVFAGVGSVLSFLPIIVTLFFFLSILEDSGYMARVAFVMDKLLRKIGLSGRALWPMLIGFGAAFRHLGHATLSSTGPDNDHPADALHERFRQAAHLCGGHGGVLPPTGRSGDVSAVCNGHGHRGADRPFDEKYDVPRQSGALCDGAAQLSSSQPQKCGAAAVGQGQRRSHPRVPRSFSWPPIIWFLQSSTSPQRGGGQPAS